MQLGFETVDVFTDRRFGGNPLAVIADGRGLSDAQMQAIAAEFNLSETTFVLPPRSAAHTAQVRIFTPRAELPFAGHPNVGTAFVLARQAERAGRAIAGDRMLFEEGAGLVAMDLLRRDGQVSGARLASPQPLSLGATLPAEIVAEACGLAAGDIVVARHPPIIAGCGTPFGFAEVKSRDALAKARPRSDIFERHLPAELLTGIHLYVETPGGEADIHARMFAPLHGVSEDPATGSANVALIGLLAQLAGDPPARLEKVIAQGDDMGRPSRMLAAAEANADGTIATSISGACVPVMRGTIDVA